MAWLVQAQEIARLDNPNKGSGKFRMTATSDEDGGGPYGNSCHHDSAEEAQMCEACDEYISRISGFPSRKKMNEIEITRDIAEYNRLKEKFGD